MSTDESEFETVRRHVREGAGHVANQRALVIRLGDHGPPTAKAEALLATFEASKCQHEAHLSKVGAERPLGQC
jgi:hypothetical protein